MSQCTPSLQDCVSLLASSCGTLALARDSLASTGQAGSSTLQELGVARLNQEQALLIIATRVDLEI